MGNRKRIKNASSHRNTSQKKIVRLLSLQGMFIYLYRCEKLLHHYAIRNVPSNDKGPPSWPDYITLLKGIKLKGQKKKKGKILTTLNLPAQ